MRNTKVALGCTGQREPVRDALSELVRRDVIRQGTPANFRRRVTRKDVCKESGRELLGEVTTGEESAVYAHGVVVTDLSQERTVRRVGTPVSSEAEDRHLIPGDSANLRPGCLAIPLESSEQLVNCRVPTFSEVQVLDRKE